MTEIWNESMSWRGENFRYKKSTATGIYYGNELAQSIKASLDIKFGFIHTLQVYLQVAFQLFSVHWVQHAVSISIDKLFELYILSYLINNTWTC